MEVVMDRESLVLNYDEYHVQWYANGSRKGKKDKRVIDMCLFPVDSYLGKAGEYEVMYLSGEGETLDEYHTFDWNEACDAYARMVRAYCPQSWKNLIEALNLAKAVAESVCCHDGGACNFDSPALHIPEGMTYQQVLACCNAANVTCYGWKPSKKSEKLAVIGCVGVGQAGRRTEGAEAACKFLNDYGYTCGMYYEMD